MTEQTTEGYMTEQTLKELRDLFEGGFTFAEAVGCLATMSVEHLIDAAHHWSLWLDE